MAKFIVFETYRIEHEVEADTADEAVEKVSEDDAYQYTIDVRYDHRQERPEYEYVSESTCVIDLEIYK